MTVSDGIERMIKKGKVGVNDKGEIKGVSIGKRTIEDLVLKIANSTEPRIFPEIEVVEIRKKKLIVIRVSERRR